jgi:nucleotide-binding universal stress UspA family protein
MVSPGSGPGETAAAPSGPVLFAYDGSELARLAIEEAGRQLANGREAVALCVWQPVDVGFVLAEGQHLNCSDASEVRKMAEQVAAQGAALASAAGFRAKAVAVEASPTWQGIAEAAEEHDAGLIVFGAHHRSGLKGHLLGSVTGAFVKHSTLPVLIVQERS